MVVYVGRYDRFHIHVGALVQTDATRTAASARLEKSLTALEQVHANMTGMTQHNIT